MILDVLRYGDVGNIIELTIKDEDEAVVDVSTATIKRITFRKPNGARIVRTATFTNTGSDGKVQYITVAGDVDAIGTWEAQAYVKLANLSEYSSTIKEFRVTERL